MSNPFRTLALLSLGSLAGTQVFAAEGFQIRYNIAGSLGGEVFAPPDATGFAAGAAYTFIDIKKVTGGDGKTLTMPVAGGVVPLPAPTPPELYPSYDASLATVEGTGTLKLTNLALGFVTRETYGGGRVVVGLNIPYGVKTQSFKISAATPALHWSPAIPPETQAAVAAQFGSGFQAGLEGQAAAETGEVSGLGDVELQAGWLYAQDQWRVLAGASLVAPTGRYSAAAGPDIGHGNFYTFRPAVQVGYLVAPELAVAGKLTLGINTENEDNRLRSGNWASLEGAVGYKTPVGAIGLHTVYVQQIQDDANNVWGASRFRTMNLGAYFTTVVPGIEAVATLQLMKTTESRNAKAGDFSQIRLIKVF